MNLSFDSKEQALDALYQYREHFDPKPTEIQLNNLAFFLNQLWSFNQEYNLMSRKLGPKEIIENHVLDCWICFKHFPKAKRIADLGSGGGFPGILLAIFFPESEILLYEKSPVKCKFLNNLKDSNFNNIQIMGAIPDTKIDCDLITARAFKPISVILKLSNKNFKAKTKYCLLKARKVNITEDLDACPKGDYKIIELNHPLLEVERHLVVF